MLPNAAVEGPRAALSSAQQARNEKARLLGGAWTRTLNSPLPANVQFSGRATTCHARRRRTMATPRLRRAGEDVSRFAATG
jgi:hypothetical protein